MILLQDDEYKGLLELRELDQQLIAVLRQVNKKDDEQFASIRGAAETGLRIIHQLERINNLAFVIPDQVLQTHVTVTNPMYQVLRDLLEVLTKVR